MSTSSNDLGPPLGVILEFEFEAATHEGGWGYWKEGWYFWNEVANGAMGWGMPAKLTSEATGAGGGGGDGEHEAGLTIEDTEGALSIRMTSGW